MDAVTDIGALLVANLHRVFDNRDAATRRAAIDELFAEDVVFIDPEETVTGRDGVDRKAAGLLEKAPAEWVLAEAGPVYLAVDFGALPWTFGPAGAPIVRGVDIVPVRDGRIVELRTALAAD